MQANLEDAQYALRRAIQMYPDLRGARLEWSIRLAINSAIDPSAQSIWILQLTDHNHEISRDFAWRIAGERNTFEAAIHEIVSDALRYHWQIIRALFRNAKVDFFEFVDRIRAKEAKEAAEGSVKIGAGGTHE